MAGKIIVSTLQSDTDNSISFVANTGATIFSANISHGIAGSFIANGSITGAKIALGTITGDDIATGQITGNLLTANCVSGNNIVANTISNTSIQTGAVENYMTAQGLDFGMRNRIINGTMVIDQRNAGANTIISSNAPYTVDRWRAQISQHNGTMNVRQDSTSTVGFTKSLRAIVTTANTSLPATSVTRVWTNIEGLNVADLGFGTANAKPVTLSFFVRSSNTGTFSGALTNYDENRSYPFEYTINTVNTFEKKTITIPGDTSGNWSSNTEGSFALNFSLGTGTTNLGTANAWTGSWKVGTTGSFSLAGVLNATWYLTGVQLEEGSVPTSFEYRQHTTELALCQRYYYKIKSLGTGYDYALGYAVSSTVYRDFTPFPVTMRTNPTSLEQTGTASDYSVRAPASTVTCSAVPFYYGGITNGAVTEYTVASGLTTGQGSSSRFPNVNGYVAWSAEL